MSSISSRSLSTSSLIFLPFLATSGLAVPASPPSLGFVGRVSFFVCSAIGPIASWSLPGPAPGLDGGEYDPPLALVLPLPVRVGDQAGLVRLEEEDLGDPLVSIDSSRQRGRIRHFERDETLPLGLEGRHVGDDAAPRVRALADRDRHHVAGDLEVLDRPAEGERVGGVVQASPLKSTNDRVSKCLGSTIELLTFVKILNSSAIRMS